MKNSLEHIAFIMDGNGRWAQKRGENRTAGHKKGAETLLNICQAAKEMGIKYMTVYAFSTENWNRPKTEVDYLMNLLRHYLDQDFQKLKDNNIRICFIGEREMLAPDILEKMEKIEQETASNASTTLQIALSYGSRAEILHAVKETVQRVKNGDMLLKDIDEKNFSSMLYTKTVPDPDILIRTSGEKRLSNFLLWQSAYTEFFFTDTLWPDFTKEELTQIIETYQTRERRYGKI